MRLWSLHPAYLDARGLVALWREGLLAQKVLAGQTRGYRHHPQLQRFRSTDMPLAAIATYLEAVADEADRRAYRFDRSRLKPDRTGIKLELTDGQLAYETAHLRDKLKLRSPGDHERLQALLQPRPHPLFALVKGDIEPWEKINSA